MSPLPLLPFASPEWLKLREHVDPHYHVVLDLLLMGMIGSEQEWLLKQHVRGETIQIRCSVVRDKGVAYMKFKPKNWYRKRDLPMTGRMREIMDRACAASNSHGTITFANDIAITANEFVLTMKRGCPCADNY